MRSSTLRRRLLVVVSLAACVSIALPALAGEVTGKLVLGAYKPPRTPVQGRPAFQWELENGFKQVVPDRVDAVRELAVVLVGAGPAPGVDRVEVALRGGSLLPSTLVLRVGSTLAIRNDDEIAHEVFAQGMEGFSAEAISLRGVRSVNLAAAGNWPLRDNLVSHVRGHLHVLADLVAIAKVARDGTFAFGEVPPGKYTLKVFHGSVEVLSQAVEATDKALAVDPITLMAAAAKP